MQDHALKGLGMWRHILWVHGRDNHTCIRHLRSIAPIAPDNAQNARTYLLRVLQRQNQVWTDIPFYIPTADRKDEHNILLPQTAGAQPFLKYACPSLVVRACGQLGNVVSWRVGFDSGKLAKVIDGMRGIRRAAANANNEQASPSRARLCEEVCYPFNVPPVQSVNNLTSLGKKRVREIHLSFCREIVSQLGYPSLRAYLVKSFRDLKRGQPTLTYQLLIKLFEVVWFVWLQMLERRTIKYA